MLLKRYSILKRDKKAIKSYNYSPDPFVVGFFSYYNNDNSGSKLDNGYKKREKERIFYDRFLS